MSALKILKYTQRIFSVFSNSCHTPSQHIIIRWTRFVDCYCRHVLSIHLHAILILQLLALFCPHSYKNYNKNSCTLYSSVASIHLFLSLCVYIHVFPTSIGLSLIIRSNEKSDGQSIDWLNWCIKNKTLSIEEEEEKPISY